MINWRIVNTIRRFLRTSWLKSAYLNFSFLPFSQAIRFPIIVSRYTYFYSLPGKIEFGCPVRFGICRIGFLGEDVVVPRSERALLQIEGKLILGSNVRIGCGSIIRVEPNATLSLGQDVRIGSKSKIIAYDSITIGNNTGISWDCQIMDSNMHDMVNIHSGKLLTLSKPVTIGANSWIGARVTLMKGCELPDYTIVGAGSFCSGHYDIPNYSIIAGHPARLIKTGFKRADY